MPPLCMFPVQQQKDTTPMVDRSKEVSEDYLPITSKFKSKTRRGNRYEMPTRSARVAFVTPNRFITSTTPNASGAHIAGSATVMTSSRNAVNSTILPSDVLPDLPPWFVHLLAAWLSFAFVAATVLYFVNFPPGENLRRYMRQRQIQQQQGVYSRSANSINARLGHENTLLPPQPASEAAVTTSSHSPLVFSPALDATSVRRRAGKTVPLSIDTTAQYGGLGIAVPGEGHQPSPPADWMAGRACRNFSMRDSDSSTGSTVAWNQSWCGTLKAPSETPGHDEEEYPPDIEAGVHTPGRATNPPSRRNAKKEDIHGLAESSCEKTSSMDSILKKVERGIEWSAERIAKLMHDQIREEGGAEEGLVLHVRDCERERK